MYEVIRGCDIIQKLQGIASKKSAKEASSTVSRAKKWRKVGQSAWSAIEKENSSFDVESYIATLDALARVEYQSQLVDAGITEPTADIFSFKSIRNNYPVNEGLYTCYLTYYVPAAITRDLQKLIVVDPKDEYPCLLYTSPSPRD